MNYKEENKVTLSELDLTKIDELGDVGLSQDEEYWCFSLGGEGVLFFPSEEQADTAREKILRKIIPLKVRQFLAKIPENAGRTVMNYTDVQGNKIDCISKIDGRVEWQARDLELNVEGEDTYTTFWTWYFDSKPREWEDHFDLNDMPRFGKKIITEMFA